MKTRYKIGQEVEFNPFGLGSFPWPVEVLRNGFLTVRIRDTHSGAEMGAMRWELEGPQEGPGLLARLCIWLKGPWDPMKHCKVHRGPGCTHVDGFLCNKSYPDFDPPPVVPEVKQAPPPMPVVKCSTCSDRKQCDFPPWGIVKCPDCD